MPNHRPGTSVRRPCAELLEGRNLPSGFHPAHAAAPEPHGEEPPALYSRHEEGKSGEAHRTDRRDEDGIEVHGLGRIVSAWTHQGIHGRELADRIHALQGKTTGSQPGQPDDPPPVSDSVTGRDGDPGAGLVEAPAPNPAAGPTPPTSTPAAPPAATAGQDGTPVQGAAAAEAVVSGGPVSDPSPPAVPADTAATSTAAPVRTSDAAADAGRAFAAARPLSTGAVVSAREGGEEAVVRADVLAAQRPEQLVSVPVAGATTARPFGAGAADSVLPPDGVANTPGRTEQSTGAAAAGEVVRNLPEPDAPAPADRAALSGGGDEAAAEAAPQESGLLESVPPASPEAARSALDAFLCRVDDLVSSLADPHGLGAVVPWVVAAAGAGAAYRLSRRRRAAPATTAEEGTAEPDPTGLPPTDRP